MRSYPSKLAAENEVARLEDMIDTILMSLVKQSHAGDWSVALPDSEGTGPVRVRTEYFPSRHEAVARLCDHLGIALTT